MPHKTRGLVPVPVLLCYDTELKMENKKVKKKKNFDTMYLVTPDVHNKLLVVIQKRAAELLPVEKKIEQIFN